MRRKSIVNRLTGWYLLCLFVSVAFATGFLYLSLKKALRKNDVSVIENHLQAVTSILERPVDPMGALVNRVELEWPTRKTGVVVSVQDSSGKVMVESPGATLGVSASVMRALFQSKPATDRLEDLAIDGRSYLITRRELDHPMAGASEIRIALEVSDEYLLLRNHRNRLIAVLAIVLFLSAFVGRKLAKEALRPVRSIMEAATRIRSSTLHERIEGTFPAELEPLSLTINEMLDRLEESFRRLDRFSSDLAHELRTPLNNLRGEMEVALGKTRSPDEYREVLGSGLEEVDRLAKIIDSLLFVAKAEDPGTQIRREHVVIRAEIERVVEFYEVASAEADVKIQTEVPENLELDVEKTLFQRALANVLANAINYSRKGSTVRVSAQSEKSWIHIEVRDQGDGIPSEKRPFIFDRLYRADPSRKAGKFGGFGLGLTIVKSILKLHAGEVTVESETGQGTTVRLSFPRATS